MSIYSLPAGAATFTVTNLNDSGAGSLRQAILDANATLGADMIAFQTGLTGAITLTSGEIKITDALTLNGPGAGVLAISGNNASRIFNLPEAMNGKALTINSLTLKNAVGNDPSGWRQGGAIKGGGSLLTLNHCILTGNSTPSSGGGAIYKQDGILTVSNSQLINNSAGWGGAIAQEMGARIPWSSTVIVNNSTLAYNSAVYEGGGIYDYGSHVGESGNIVIVNNSTVFGNSAKTGGGIWHEGFRLEINGSTLSGNSATQGGAITFIGTYGPSTSKPGDTGIIANSIIAGNIAATGKEIYRDTANHPGLLTSLGHNLFGENGADGLVNVTKATSDLVLPGLIANTIGDLADNGGPTQTQLPVVGSLVIDHGDNALIPQGVTTDQRGLSRIVNGIVDIGAVEVGSSTPLTPGSAVGVFRNGQWFLDANGNGVWDGCGTEFCFTGFGQAGDLPASGNWDGGSKSYIGVLRSGTGQWFIDRNGNRQWDGCATDGCYVGFGTPGDFPVAGDWSGSGFAKIGVFRSGQWYLDNGNGAWDGCSTELCLSFGQTGDLPVAGNWDGGLKAGVGVFRAGTWYLDYNGNGAWDGCQQDGGQDLCLYGSFGQVGDLPAAGDWNGDGKAKVGVFRNGTWYLDYNGNGAWDGCGVDRCYFGSFGQQGDLPVAGKW
ncbi:MAG: hypothetical protein JNK95_02555 [Candidatus Competibacter sp.]|nr:hypothetical protein [Candidatus Competibacter sp.]